MTVLFDLLSNYDFIPAIVPCIARNIFSSHFQQVPAATVMMNTTRRTIGIVLLSFLLGVLIFFCGDFDEDTSLSRRRWDYHFNLPNTEIVPRRNISDRGLVSRYKAGPLERPRRSEQSVLQWGLAADIQRTQPGQRYRSKLWYGNLILKLIGNW